MPSPMIVARKWWQKLLTALPTIIPLFTVLGLLLYAAALYAIDNRIITKLVSHEVNPYSHSVVVELTTKYEVLRTEMKNVEEKLGEVVSSNKITYDKISEAVTLLEKLNNKK